jgi:N-ethylmaleimide reductase
MKNAHSKIVSEKLPHLFSPLQLGDVRLAHRVVMAPLTRMRSAQPGNVPQALNEEYYSQRATNGGLIITEATQISAQGLGYPGTPGIHSVEQTTGWQKVVHAVHEKGGLIFLQLWHVGRISHSSLHANGAIPVAPSAVRPSGEAFTSDGRMVPFETPRALEQSEIHSIVEDYKNAALNAQKAGFDGVEIHGANGYLIDQFLRDKTNHREDEYGGSIENRTRFLVEVAQAVVGVWGGGRVGVRFSPFGSFGDMSDSHPEELFSLAVVKMGALGLAYIHLVEPRQDESLGLDISRWGSKSIGSVFRDKFPGRIIAAGGYTGESAESAIAAGDVDAVAFGRNFIANPDLPKRLAVGAALNPYHRDSFYGGTEKGYTDYPFLAQEAAVEGNKF